MHSKEAAIYIGREINGLIAPQLIDKDTFDQLKSVVKSLFALLPNPNDDAAQRNMVEHLCGFIAEVNFGPTTPEILKEPIYAILLCVQGVQVAAMRGNIPLKNPFDSKPYLEIYKRHCPNVIIQDEEWLIRIETQLLSAKQHHIAMHMWIYNDRTDKLQNVYEQIVDIGDSIHVERLLAFARAHDKYISINFFIEKIEPEIFDIISDKIIDRIRQASPTITQEIADFLEPSFAGELKNFIMALADDGMIVLSEQDNSTKTPTLMLKKENNGEVSFTQLHHSEDHRPAPSEIDSVIDILHTILHRLEDGASRRNFFEQGNLKPMSAALLCSQAFYLSIMLGSNTHDKYFNLSAYAYQHNRIFKSDIRTDIEFAQWHCRLLNLLSLVKPYEDNQNDSFGSDANPLPLNIAIAKKADINIIKDLINQGADINAVDASGYPPLHVAILHQHDEAFDFLMAQPGIQLSIQDNKFHTAIWHAVMLGKVNQANVLFKAGIVMSKNDLYGRTDHGYTLLDVSLRFNIEAVSKVLLTKDVNWSQRDSDFNTPLHHAVKYSPATARLILFRYPQSRHALTLVNFNGETPLDRVETDTALSRDIQILKKFYPAKQS